jgi:predicted RNA-binding protein YlxR (DUF448 family)
VVPQRELVRVAVSGDRVVLDPKRALPGRGAYVHPVTRCVTVPGLAKALRRQVTKSDLERIVAGLAELSPAGDKTDVKSAESDEATPERRDDPSENAPGLAGTDTVETQPRIKAKDDRSEDARV